MIRYYLWSYPKGMGENFVKRNITIKGNDNKNWG